MIVGDSITQGSAGDYTWQYWLYEHLRDDGVKPTMVGPYGWLYNNVTNRQKDDSYANPDFERANDAFWGLTLFNEKTEIGGLVRSYRPDYLLVLLGLNDLFWYALSQPVMAANLADFISAARAADPRIRIVLGLVPPDIHERTNPVFADAVASYNASIASTAARLSTTASPIAVAADGAHINIAEDLWDGTHPNTNGQIRIAAAFADVLASRFRLGQPNPTPFPVMPTGPLTPLHLTVRPSLTLGQAVLLWNDVPGAGSYYVYERDVTKGQTTFKRLPWPLSIKQNPWTAGLLTAGNVYAFKLQACKGADCGAFSNQASVTAP
jgi:lysophospholipase L1-like esterase